MAQLKFDAQGLIKGLSGLQSTVDLQTRAYAETAAQLLQNEMKNPEGVPFREEGISYTRNQYEIMAVFEARLKWRDRTGEARRRLKAYVTSTLQGYKITLSHGVWYGIYLEKAFAGVYAVIDPALKTKSPEIMKGWARLLQRLMR